MEKGYYLARFFYKCAKNVVSIHNKNGKGLLLGEQVVKYFSLFKVSIHNKNGKGLLLFKNFKWDDLKSNVSIHNKNGKGLLHKSHRS